MLPYLKPILPEQDFSQAQSTRECHLAEALASHLELSFKVFGHMVPIDHGYQLYSALSHLQPTIHRLGSEIAIQSITGKVDKRSGVIHLHETSQLRFRLPIEQIPLIYTLAGRTLTIGKHKIRLGIPETHFLKPFGNLYARIAVIKGYQDSKGFIQAAQRQIEQMGIQGNLHVAVRADGSMKYKSIKAAGYIVNGFGVEIFDLTEKDSIKLQIHGIGGKRKMGCGIFIPMKEQ